MLIRSSKLLNAGYCSEEDERNPLSVKEPMLTEKFPRLPEKTSSCKMIENETKLKGDLSCP